MPLTLFNYQRLNQQYQPISPNAPGRYQDDDQISLYLSNSGLSGQYVLDCLFGVIRIYKSSLLYTGSVSSVLVVNFENNIPTITEIKRALKYQGNIFYSPEGTLFVTEANGIKKYDLQWNALKSITLNKNYEDIIFNQNGSLIFCKNYVLDQNLNLLRTLPTDPISACSPSGNIIAVVKNNPKKILIYDQLGNLLFTHHPYLDPSNFDDTQKRLIGFLSEDTIVYNHSQKVIYYANHYIEIWNYQTGSTIRVQTKIQTQEGTVYSLAVSPNRSVFAIGLKSIAGGNSETQATLYDSQGNFLAYFYGINTGTDTSSNTLSLSFSSDGNSLLKAVGSGRIEQWRSNPPYEMIKSFQLSPTSNEGKTRAIFAGDLIITSEGIIQNNASPGTYHNGVFIPTLANKVFDTDLNPISITTTVQPELSDYAGNILGGLIAENAATIAPDLGLTTAQMQDPDKVLAAIFKRTKAWLDGDGTADNGTSINSSRFFGTLGRSGQVGYQYETTFWIPNPNPETMDPNKVI